MERKSVFIRVDGGEHIGFGHVYRCLSLAFYIESIVDITFIIKDSGIDFSKVIKNRFPVILIEADINREEEWRFIEKHFADVKDALVILDGYHFNLEYQKTIKAAGHTLLIVDGIYNEAKYADIIVNYNLYADASKYGSPKARILTGSDYSLLRLPFLKAAQMKGEKIFNEKANMLLTFGGVDQFNLTLRVLTDLAKIHKKDEIGCVSILLGIGYKHKQALLEFMSTGLPFRVEIFEGLDAEGIVKLFRTCDLAISPGGVTVYEIFSVGIPLITGHYVDNQILNANYIQENGLGVNLGDFRRYDLYYMNSKFEEALFRREELLVNQKKTIDGRQMERFISLVNQL